LDDEVLFLFFPRPKYFGSNMLRDQRLRNS
jgi:hypothetical protein